MLKSIEKIEVLLYHMEDSLNTEAKTEMYLRSHLEHARKVVTVIAGSEGTGPDRLLRLENLLDQAYTYAQIGGIEWAYSLTNAALMVMSDIVSEGKY